MAKALLFFGCRSPAADCLYREQLDEWVKLGAVDVRYAFSKEPESSEGCKYVQDRMIKDKKDVYELWDEGAKFYTCGSREVAQEVGSAARKLVKERAEAHGKTMNDEELDNWFAEKRGERFVSDVFS